MDTQQKSAKIALYTFLEILATFILTAVAGMYDWVNTGFTLSRVTTSAYWESTIMQTGMYSCALIIGLLGMLQHLELKSLEYDTLLKDYRAELTISGMVKSVTKLFIKYINDFLNPEIKKEYIRKKYDNKLYKLDKLSKDQWKLDYRDYEKTDPDSRKDFKWSSSFSYKYYIKRTRLERMRDDAFINENYEIISCNYPRVNPYAFTWFLSIKASDRLKYKVENKTLRDVALKVINKFVFALLGGAIIGLLLVEPNVNELAEQANGWIAIMIRYIVRVVMIVANILLGISTAKKLFQENNLLPISNRTRILIDYKNFASAHPEEFKEVIPLYKQEALEQAKLEEKQKFDNKVEEIKEELAKKNLRV